MKSLSCARQWAKKFKLSLQKIGFEVSLMDPCLMIRQNEDGTVILCIYVDDVCLCGDKKAVEAAIKDIKKIFDIRKEGHLNDYLGCIIKFDDDGDDGTIHQPHILKRLENKFQEITKHVCKKIYRAHQDQFY